MITFYWTTVLYVGYLKKLDSVCWTKAFLCYSVSTCVWFHTLVFFGLKNHVNFVCECFMSAQQYIAMPFCQIFIQSLTQIVCTLYSFVYHRTKFHLFGLILFSFNALNHNTSICPCQGEHNTRFTLRSIDWASCRLNKCVLPCMFRILEISHKNQFWEKKKTENNQLLYRYGKCYERA